MLTRRQLFIRGSRAVALGASARSVVASPRPAGDRAATELVIGAEGRAVTRVMLSDNDRSALSVITGVRGRLLLDPDSLTDRETLSIVMGQRYAMLRWNPSGHACRITLPGDPSSFVTSWALPLLGEGGFIGYAPGEDLPVLLSFDQGRFHRVRNDLRAPLPEGLNAAGALYACFFGDWSLAGVQRQLERLESQLDDSAYIVANTAIEAGHAPVALLTAFV